MIFTTESYAGLRKSKRNDWKVAESTNAELLVSADPGCGFDTPVSFIFARLLGLKGIRMIRFLCGGVVLALCFFAFWLDLANAQKIRLAHAFVSGSALPLWIAKEEGLFKKYGLDVEMVFIGGARATQALLAGDVQILASGGQPIVLAASKGADVKMFASVVNVIPMAILTAKGIRRPKDLQGGKVGIATFGSASEFAAVFGLKKLGLDAYKDVTMIQLGGDPVRLAALESGSVQAVTLAPPVSFRARRLGYNVLIDLSAMDIEYPQVTLASAHAYIRTHDDMILRFSKAFVEGVHLFHSQDQAAFKVLRKYMKIEDSEVAMDTIKGYRSFIPKKPYPTIKGIRFLIEAISPKQPTLKGMEPESFVETKFVQELDQSGFIDSLYSKGR